MLHITLLNANFDVKYMYHINEPKVAFFNNMQLDWDS